MTIRIDKELQSLIPPLSEEELEGLEKSILKEGVRDPLVVWAETGILVDGHNRYRIATEHNIGFAISERSFANRVEVIDWMVNNQCRERRNLDKGQKAALYIDAAELKYREEAKAKQDANRRANLKQNQSSTRADQLVGSGDKTDNAPDGQQSVLPARSSSCHTEKVGQRDLPDVGEKSLEKSPYEADVPIEVVHIPDKSRIPTSDARSRARSNETAYRIAKDADLGVGTVKRVMAVKHGDDELYDKVKSGEMTASKAYTTLQERKKKADEKEAMERSETTATIRLMAYDNSSNSCKLLITEAPSDPSWLTGALWGVAHDGFAYVIVDDDAETLRNYLNAETPPNIDLYQVLVWRFTYLMGNNDTRGYKPNKKFILFYRGTEAPNISYINAPDRESVIAIEADGGNLGDAEYKLWMPMALAEKLIRQSTKEGDVVFDPFAKRGTTLLAAKKLGRNAIGYESDDDLVNMAISNGVNKEL